MRTDNIENVGQSKNEPTAVTQVSVQLNRADELAATYEDSIAMMMSALTAHEKRISSIVNYTEEPVAIENGNLKKVGSETEKLVDLAKCLQEKNNKINCQNEQLKELVFNLKLMTEQIEL
jgi:hypothetical protein